MGKTKKEAEEEAAQKALLKLNSHLKTNSQSV